MKERGGKKERAPEQVGGGEGKGREGKGREGAEGDMAQKWMDRIGQRRQK